MFWAEFVGQVANLTGRLGNLANCPTIELKRRFILKIDTALLVSDLGEMPEMVRAVETLGFDGIWTAETAHEPFLPLVLAAEHSQKVSLGTSIAVAFPRSPAVLAYIGWDLARFSKGRFIMGLGTQVKGHNERRFGVKWEKPA